MLVVQSGAIDGVGCCSIVALALCHHYGFTEFEVVLVERHIHDDVLARKVDGLRARSIAQTTNDYRRWPFGYVFDNEVSGFVCIGVEVAFFERDRGKHNGLFVLGTNNGASHVLREAHNTNTP